MKIEVYIEHGEPLIVFPQQINANKTIGVYSRSEGHAQATRAYLRTLAMPQTAEETKAAWRVLKWYASIDE